MKFEEWDQKKNELIKEIESEIEIIRNDLLEIRLAKDIQFRESYLVSMASTYLNFDNNKNYRLNDYDINEYFTQFYKDNKFLVKKMDAINSIANDQLYFKNYELENQTMNRIISLYPLKVKLENMYIAWILYKGYNKKYSEVEADILNYISEIRNKGIHYYEIQDILWTYERNQKQTQEALKRKEITRLPIIPKINKNLSFIDPKKARKSMDLTKTNLFKVLALILAYNQKGLIFNLSVYDIKEILKIKQVDTIRNIISFISNLSYVLIQNENTDQPNIVISDIAEIYGINLDLSDSFLYVPNLFGSELLSNIKFPSLEKILFSIYLEKAALKEDCNINTKLLLNIFNFDERQIQRGLKNLLPKSENPKQRKPENTPLELNLIHVDINSPNKFFVLTDYSRCLFAEYLT